MDELPTPVTRRDEYLHDIASSLRTLVGDQTGADVQVGRVELREPAVDLDGMTRDQLEVHADAVGVETPGSYPNKDALKRAIREAG